MKDMLKACAQVQKLFKEQNESLEQFKKKTDINTEKMEYTVAEYFATKDEPIKEFRRWVQESFN